MPDEDLLPEEPLNNEDRIAMRSEERREERRSKKMREREEAEATRVIAIVLDEMDIQDEKGPVKMSDDASVLLAMSDAGAAFNAATRAGVSVEALRQLCEIVRMARAIGDGT